MGLNFQHCFSFNALEMLVFPDFMLSLRDVYCLHCTEINDVFDWLSALLIEECS